MIILEFDFSMDYKFDCGLICFKHAYDEVWLWNTVIWMGKLWFISHINML